MKEGPKFFAQSRPDSSKGNQSFAIQYPKLMTFLKGCQKGGMPLLFSDTGMGNLARRFKIPIEQLQAIIADFGKGGSYGL